MSQITVENCRDVCLKLWKQLSTTEHWSYFDKHKILQDMGFVNTQHGCPLCHVYCNDRFETSCVGCPIRTYAINHYAPEFTENRCGPDGCFACEKMTPYESWRHHPCPENARVFYVWLLDLFGVKDEDVVL